MDTANAETLLELNEGGETFRDRVRNPMMFKAYMLGKMPVLGVTGSYLAHIGTRRCEMVCPYGWRTKNLFGRLFDSAVVAAAETTSLALLVLHIRNRGADLGAEMAHLDVRAHRSVTEDVRVRCDGGLAYAEFVERGRSGGLGEHTFEASVETEAGVRTHDIEVTWRLVEG